MNAFKLSTVSRKTRRNENGKEKKKVKTNNSKPQIVISWNERREHGSSFPKKSNHKSQFQPLRLLHLQVSELS